MCLARDIILWERWSDWNSRILHKHAYRTIVRTSQRTQFVSISKLKFLILFSKISVVWVMNHMKKTVRKIRNSIMSE